MKTLYQLIYGAIFLLLALPTLAADPNSAKNNSSTHQPGIIMNQSILAELTPNQALDILKAGNARFLSGKTLERDEKGMIKQTALGQFPAASIVACMDSRSGPEIVFDLSKGDIFVNRVAGNVINDDIVGGLEYGSKAIGTPLIVVLGHTDCGAVKGACDGIEMGNLTQLLDKIKPAIKQSKVPGARNSKNTQFVNDVTELNVDVSIKKIRESSPILRDLESQGKLKIVGAIYDTSSGKVLWK